MEQEYTKVIDLIFLAKQDGIEFVLNEERLQLKIPDNKIIDSSLLQEIRTNKNLIIEFLSNENWKSRSVTKNHNKINRVDRKGISHIPLSFSQERLWFIDMLEGSVQYNLPTVLRLKGPLNRQALENALQTILARHEALRTIFREHDGQPSQYIRDNEEWHLNIIDGSVYQLDAQELQKYIDELIRKPFDLSHDYMMRADLIVLNDQEYVVVVTMHHIASDAWSLPIIVREVVELYRAFEENREAVLTPIEIQYADFAIWQRKHLQGDLMDKKVSYWKDKLEGVSPLQLPTDYARPSVKSIKGAITTFRIAKELAASVKLLSQQQGTSLFMTLLSVFKVLLHRYSGQQDICVGTSIAGRQPEEVVGLIGFFANTLALRTDVNPALSFTSLLQKVKQTTMEAYEHQEVSFEKVVETVAKDRDASRSPLFQVMLVLHNTPDIPQLQLGEVQLSRESFENNISKFDITFFINESPNGMQGSVQYRTDLFTEETIERMMAHFKELLSSVTKSPKQSIGSLPMLTMAEEEQLLVDFNDSQVTYPKDKTIVDLFEQQAAKTPDAIALVFEDQQLSYKQLNERANQLAHYLRTRGVKEDSLVPLCVERSHEMLVGILGILKAGAAYVPIEPDFPEDRKSFVLEDTAATVVVSSTNSSSTLPYTSNLDIIEVDGEWSAIKGQPVHNVHTALAPHHLAYVIYTSGSTGKPKGVMIEHRNLVDYVFGLNHQVQVDQCKSYALVSSIATDLGNTVIYSSLVFGGALHVFSKDSVSNIEYLHDYFNEHSIDCLKIVPSHWKALSEGENLLLPSKLMVFGGEALQSELVNNILASGTSCRVVNHYGPTETSIGKLLHIVTPGGKYNKTIPIGKPFSNTSVYVLSKESALCPIGVAGELHIAGDGLARGYLNNSDLTRQKFIASPFDKKDRTLLYRTGDLVKYLPDGNIEFIGRVDDQVKIRGYRVELGEIENTILQSGQASGAVVLAKEDKDGNKRLAGYIVASEDFDKESLMAYLKEKLPDYMVPGQWVEMEHFPLLPNGKIDRKSLPDPEGSEQLSGQYIAPRNETETKLAALWMDVLEVEQVGIHDDFFELGGHSLLAVRLISAIRKEFVVEMPISDIFDFPTVALLAEQLGNSSAAELLPVILANKTRPEKIPLSFSQERLWFIDQLEGSVQYHVPTVLRLKGKLNTDALSYALQQMLNRHEVLRTVIIQEEGQPYQHIMDKDGWKLSAIDGSIYSEDQEGLQRFIMQLIRKPFDLSKDFLLRAELIRIGVEDHIIVTTMHHIGSDAWSTPILVKEVAELYSSFEENRTVQLNTLPIQYADYAIWQRNYLQGEVLEKKLSYWKQKLGDVTTLQLPTDFPRPTVQSTRGAAVNFRVDKEVTDKIQQISQQHGATLFMTLLAAYKILLQRYSDQQDICVGTSIANRTQQEVEGLVGFFVNTLALRSEVRPESSFTKLLQEVKQTTMEAYEHQDVPFEKVVDTVTKERDLSRSPLFQVMLVLRNTAEIPELRLGDVTLSGVPYELTTSKFDITFFINETGNGLQCSVQYRTDLFREQTIGQMMNHFKQLLSSIANSPNQSIGSLSMLTLPEEQQLLVGFNNSSVIYPKDKTIIDLFEEQAAKTPGEIALIFEDQELTYKQLNERSNQLAHYLRSRGVKEDSLVPLCVERSHEMLVGILGILKAGAAYVPIEPDFPEDRKTFVIEDTAATVIVSSRQSASDLPFTRDIDIIELDGEWSAIKGQPLHNVKSSLSPGHLAYVIYTSGSTGKPKGVMIEHRGLVDYVFGLNKELQVDQCTSFALVSSIATDLGNTVIYSSLVFGGTLHVFSKEAVSNIEGLHRYFEDHRIDCLKIVPSHWKALSTSNQLLLPQRLLVFGGEALQSEIIYNISSQGSGCRIVNHYGPTETTIGKLLHIVHPDGKYNKTIPIGKPFSNSGAYILSKDMQLCPVGVPGQLYISGDGLARGYLNNPDLTDQKFISNRFNKADNRTMYATGDLVRWLADGNIEFIGRVDDQIKIRGYRVELGEIESMLLQSESVSQAVVLAKEDTQGNKRLVGYIVGTEEFDKESLVSFLKEKLPDYMVPGQWVQMEHFPLLPNGKIDRKSLPDPELTEQLTGQYVAPRNEAETKLVELWKDVLEVEQVGIHDDFFELGGHSLLAVRLISAIRKEFVVEMPISDIFDYPTVALLAVQVDKPSTGVVMPSIEVVKSRPAKIPLSFSQERLWFIDRLEGSLQYHVPTVLRLKGKLSREALNYSLQTLVNRHEVLRTVIVEEDGRPYQQIMDRDGWNLSIIDGSEYKENAEALQRYIKQLETAPFDLSKDYMIRGHLIVFGEEDHILVVTLHHIASDGWSKSVLVKELLELYNAKTENRQPLLPELGIQYADYAIWQRTNLDGEVFEKKLGYWKDKLREPTSLELPTDNARPAVWSTRGASINFTIEKELGEKLHRLSQQKGVTLFMTLLAAFKVLMHRYSGQNDICVGSAIAGRQQQELEGLIGFFVNTLAFRSEVRAEATFNELLQLVKKTTMDAYAHQEVPFEKVVDAVLTERSLSRNPLVQVMFALLNTPEVPDLRLGDIRLSKESFEHTSARFDITFFVNENPQGVHGSVEYSTDLYHEDTILRMIGHFKELLRNIVITPDRRLGLLPMITKEEENQLLLGFNQTELLLPKDKTVIHLFERHAEVSPGDIALVFEEQQMTYQELNERSNQLAHYLVGKGIKNGSLVPICIERSLDLIVGILGILKSGAAYVPIDPKYPEDRIHYMLEDTGALIAISRTGILSNLPEGKSLDLILIDEDSSLISNQPVRNLNTDITQQHLANVIYTSGSTGKPKGVLIEHLGLLNLVEWHNKEYKVTKSSRSTTMAGVGFDAFGWEIWPYLSIGATLFIIDDETRLYSSKLLTLFNANEITHSFMATALVHEFVSISKNKTRSLQYLLTGGDKLSSIDVEDLNYKLVNNYGPTENTVVTTSYEIRPTDKDVTPPIGSPVSNTSIYILNEENQLTPIGVAGEICLSGASLARGYLNSDELTAKKFVPNPFHVGTGSKMYRTGDIGRWLRDGNIEYLGRKDDQVKIRGYRIELGEIESVLQQTGLVSQAVVLAKDKDGDKRLLSYMVPDWHALKEREIELYRTQIASWKELYENEYSQTEGAEDIDTEFNIIGWNDSFTKEPIPAVEMKEWVDDIVDVIFSKDPGHVLEIGSGTGLIYYRLAGKVKKYIGTDLSRSSINQIEQRISKGLRNYGPTELQVCAAHEIALKDDEQVDTVVINSVVQYFPGEDYLSNVIRKSISLLKGNGRIIIGDVRDNRLLKLFKSRLLLQRLQDSVNIKEFTWAVEQDVLNEEELCFSPDYFYKLPSLFSEITHVEIQWKKSSYINELTLYRYNVVLYVDMETALTPLQWESWNDLSGETIIAQLQKGVNTIGLKDAPNPRLYNERMLLQELQQQNSSTVGDLTLAMRKENKESVQITNLLHQALSMGYSYKLFPGEDPLTVNVVFEINTNGDQVNQVINPYGNAAGGSNTNMPLFTSISSLLQKEIRNQLQQRLPEYMIPSELFIVGDMPLTPNGKVDRKFLSQRKDKTAINKLDYAAPRTEAEQILAHIWQELLALERIGIYDNFFELGGHSLLATRAVSAIRKRLYVELFIKDLFVHPTIAELAVHLGTQTKGLLLPALEPQPRPQFIPLSFSQERLWFIDRLEGSVQYHMPAQLRLKGKLDKDGLAFTLRNIVNRHEVLRTVILEENGVAYQQVLPKDGFQLSLSDGSVYKEDPQGLQKHINQFISDPFDLSKDHMLRALLVRLNDQDHILVVAMHHIASDGWSISIIVKEVVELYNSYKDGTLVQLSPLHVQYADYSIWQRKYLVGEVLESKIGYWKEKLQQVAPLQLPTDYNRPAIQSTRGSFANFKINKALSSALVSLSQQQGVTLFMTLLAGFKVLLHRYSGQQDICVGTPIAGRQQQEVEELVGFFVNTLALRTDVSSETSFTGLLQQVKATTLEAYAHQELPFEKVVDVVVKERNMARSPLFQVLFVFQNTPDIPVLQLGDVQLTRESSEHNTTKFELTFNIAQTVQGLRGSVEYCMDLFSEQTINRIMSQFEKLLGSIIENPQQKIGLLAMLDEQEQHQLLVGFNDTRADYPVNKSIIDLFEEHVNKTPLSEAVIFEETVLTYQQLHERSNQLAHYLQSRGVHAEILVPICMDRSLEMIIGIIGILKAGGAYVPIDPEYPADRIRYMLEDTAATFMITNEAAVTKLSGTIDIETIRVDSDWPMIGQQSSENVGTAISPDQLAYVIYTSGSTGRPKGAMNEHRGVVNRLTWAQDYFRLTSHDSILQKTTFCFDVSVWELLWPIIAGAKLVFAKPEGHKDNDYLKNIIQKRNITLMHFVPSMLAVFLPDIQNGDCKTLKKVLCSGEALQYSHIKLFHEKLRHVELYNLYGPTEAAIDVTNWSVKDNFENGIIKSIVPIGKPVANTSIYILNENNGLVPLNGIGQIHIGGVQVGRGYLNRPELTKEKFVTDPFSKASGARMYKTGDLGRWLANGDIEYLGRIDDQVKIRGYRIELGEIERVLQLSGMVSQAIVVAKEDISGNKRLVGYVINDKSFDKGAVMYYLQEKLPEYMVPALWVEMEKFPLTGSGKINKKLLPDPDSTILVKTKYVAPRTELEKNFVSIWIELLGVKTIGIHDNFFELGGDSILTIQVVSRARRLGYQLQPRDIFTHQTIDSLSEAILKRSADKISGEQGMLSGNCDLLPIQQWYLEDERESFSHFNQSVLFGIDKALSSEILNLAYNKLLSHHDALRFKYHNEDGEWHQEYSPYSGNLIIEDLRSVQEDMLGTVITQKADLYHRKLDIEKGVLIQMVWMQTPDTEKQNRLLLVVHHLAVDGVSWRILIENLEFLFTGLVTNQQAELGPKSSSYRQWYQALKQHGQRSNVISQISYWEKVVDSHRPLMRDKPNTQEVRIKDMHSLVISIGAAQTMRLLQDVPKVYHTDINDILLCALAMTLQKWGETDKIIIGLEGHGREEIDNNIDTSQTVGWFTSLYPILIELSEVEGAANAIKSVKEQLRQVPGKGLGYGVLKYINKEKKLARKAHWHILFNYLGQLDNVIKTGQWLSGARESAGQRVSDDHLLNEQLQVTGYVQGGQLVLNWIYNSGNYEKEAINDLVQSYQANLELLIDHCTKQQASGVVFTPSDYGLGTEISYQELDTFLEEPYNGIPRKESLEGLYRLSGLQQGMLFHGVYDERGGSYIDQFSCDLGAPDLEAFTKSWKNIIRHHSILRSAFYSDIFSVPVQAVYRDVELPVDVLDYREMTETAQAEAIKKYSNTDRSRGFDFKTAPLMRVALFRITDDHYRMLWTSHHLLFDGWSLPILMEEFLSSYELLISGKQLKQTKEDRYEDYIRYIERSDKEHEESYWRNYMEGIEQSTVLPFIESNKVRTKSGGPSEMHYLRLNETITEKIKTYSQNNRITVNTIMQGVWAYLLHQYTGSKDIVYGVVVSGRPDDLHGVEQRVGMYINTIPLHSRTKHNQRISDWLQQLQEEQVASRQYQYTPLQNIQQLTGVQGDLFDSILVFENYPVSKVVAEKKWSLNVRNVQMKEQTNYPLTITVGSSDQINIIFHYNTLLLKNEWIEAISNQFENVLLQLVSNDTEKLSNIKLLTQAEEMQVLVTFNDTISKWPENRSIIDLFEKQVSSTPGRTALVYEEQQLSYQELNERSNQLAHYLIKKGVTKETLVPICIEKSPEMMVGILGILKAGGAYVPLDASYPAERIHFMLEDTNAGIIITNKKSRTSLQVTENAEVLVIDDAAIIEEINQQPIVNLSIPVLVNQLAYIMYTSGSTGRPKGVLIEHGNVVSLVKSVDYVSLSEDDILLSTGSPSFDATTFEYWAMLLNGGQLVLCNENRLLDAALLKEEIIDRKVTTMWFTSSWFNQLVENDITVFSGLKTILVGGEKLSPYHIRKLKAAYPSIEIINGYGPTENTTFSLTYRIDDVEEGQSIPIGKPLDNRVAYILNEDQQLLPVGVTGEIYLGGAGISRGYLNNDDLSKQKFIANPFNNNVGSRLYKTGDLGRWLPDGNIEYQGRKDDQVKIRGYRIEPGEINSVLQQSGQVSQSLIVVKENEEGHKRLIGYVVPHELFNKESVTEYLRNRLPEYMVPALWVEMETLPLTSNGKIDKKALPDPDASELVSSKFVAPRNELETSLANIWKKILRLDQVGVHDNFFELGGHSLLAMRLLSSIRRDLGVEVPLVDIFGSTIETLAKKITEDHPILPEIVEVDQAPDDSIPLNEAVQIGQRVEAGIIEWGANENRKFMIPLNRKGKKVPFYGVISFNSYSLISKYMPGDQPLYYLPPTQAASVKDIASHYVKEIKQQQSSGPYAIGGFCAGGMIALEIAQQLEAQGDKVSALILFETYSPQAGLSRKSIKYKKQKFDYYKGRIMSLNKSGRSPLGLMKFLFNKTYDRFKKPFVKPLPPKFITSPEYRKYEYKPYSGKVILFQASIPPLGINDSPLMGWSEYFSDVEQVTVEGGHLGIFREPAIQKTVEELSEVLEVVNNEKKHAGVTA